MNKFHVICILFIIPFNAKSECSPDTVQFYLDKGFNQEQITQLCSTAQTTPTYQPYQKPVVIYQEGAVHGKSAEENKAINKLQGGMAARSIEITDSHLNYIRSVCFQSR